MCPQLEGHWAPLGAGRGGGKEPRVFVLLYPQQLQGSLLPNQNRQPGCSQKWSAARHLQPRSAIALLRGLPAPDPCPSRRRALRESGRWGPGFGGRVCPSGCRGYGVLGRCPHPRQETHRTGRLLRKSARERSQTPVPRAASGPRTRFRVVRGLQACVDEARPAPPRSRAPPTPGRRRGRGGRGANGRGGAQEG